MGEMLTQAPAKKARVLLADDHAALLAQSANLLMSEFDIVGFSANGLELTKAVGRLDPEVVVMDITMPGLDGIEAARRLQAAGCRAKLVFLTVHEDADYLSAALEAGATGYVVKTRLALDLLAAVHEALAGKRFISPTLIK
jgi:DNA-binding NarL/FixJ family response regulator